MQFPQNGVPRGRVSLTRDVGESIVIPHPDGRIIVTKGIRGRIHIDAPLSVKIARAELVESVGTT